MKRTVPVSLVVLLVATLGALGSACAPRPESLGQQLAVRGPFKVGGEVLWVDGTRGRVFALDPDAQPPDVRSTAVPRGVLAAMVVPATGQVLLATAGREAQRTGEVSRAPEVLLVTPRPGAAPEVTRRYELTAALDRLAPSPDGKSAIAWSSGTGTGQFFTNPNGLALIDLTRGAGTDNPIFRTIRSLGATPRDVAFSPPMTIPGAAAGSRTLAVVLADNYLTFLDLAHPQRAEITVPLRADDSAAQIVPEQILFSAETATVFVRASGAEDVYAMALEARPGGGDARTNDYVPRINQPSAGRTALDMLVYREGDRTLLLTANSTNDLSLLDAATGEFVLIPMGVPVDAILPVPAAAPEMAVLYSRRSPQAFVHFLDLKDLSSKLDANLTRRVLARRVHDLVAMPGGDQLLVVHDDARTVISILDLGPHRTDTPIQGQVPLESFDFADGTLVGVSSSLPRLGLLDLVTLSPRDVPLDYAPDRVLAIGRRVIVDHGARQGLVTVLPDPLSARSDGRVLWGFLLDGVLDDNPEE